MVAHHSPVATFDRRLVKKNSKFLVFCFLCPASRLALSQEAKQFYF